jgi:hypothetical protein
VQYSVVYLALVDGHIDAVETCVRPGEHLHVLVPVDCELSNIAIVTLWPRKRRREGRERNR